MTPPWTRLVAVALVTLALSATACSKKKGPDPANAAPAVTVRDDSEGLLLTWIDDRGDFHVEQRVTRGDARVRNLLAGTFGLVGDVPATAVTGCGLRVPYAMTSPRPESITCLACREHGRAQHLRLAEQIERLGSMPGAVITGAEAGRLAEHHRDLAGRFADGG